MIATFLGHACLQLEISEFRILIDPFISPNEKAASIDISTLNPDFILLTHGHEDHVADAVAIAKQSGAQVIANFEVANWIGEQGIKNVQPVNQGAKLKVPFGSVKVVNAIHSSSLPDGSYGGNPLGFIIMSDSGNFYHSGDTALTYDMKLIPEFATLNAAALSMGDTFTMGPEDAALAAQWVGAPQVIGIHYDTFPPIEIDHAAALACFAEAGIKLKLLKIGETIEL
jgi:L-ascorbate metabolism protein UlaG (beta-lactamase superfamily)